MNHRRLAGIDLGIASAHTVRVLDGQGATVAKRRPCLPWRAWPRWRQRRWPAARMAPG
jgi:hypothetical protein